MSRTFSLTTESATYITELDIASLSDLTQLLRICPNTLTTKRAWHREQATLIATLPRQVFPAPTLISSFQLTDRSCLQRPKSHLHRLADRLSHPSAQLCETHKALSSSLIHNLFTYLTGEISIHLHRLTPVHIRRTLPRPMPALLNRLEALQSLWTGANNYPHVSHTPAIFPFTSSGCKACVLAQIGGDTAILQDLFVACESRRSRTGRRPEPRLLRVLKSWMEWSAEGGWEEECQEMVELMRRSRREVRRYSRRCENDQAVHRRRLETRDTIPPLADIATHSSRPMAAATPDENHKWRLNEDETDDADFESTIIDYYTTPLSTPDLILSHSRASTPDTNCSPKPCLDLGLGISGCHLNGMHTYSAPRTPPHSPSRKHVTNPHHQFQCLSTASTSTYTAPLSSIHHPSPIQSQRPHFKDRPYITKETAATPKTGVEMQEWARVREYLRESVYDVGCEVVKGRGWLSDLGSESESGCERGGKAYGGGAEVEARAYAALLDGGGDGDDEGSLFALSSSSVES